MTSIISKEIYRKVNEKYHEKRIRLDKNSTEYASYWEIGEGENIIVFIHGIANSKIYWYDMINFLPKKLFKKYTALFIDLPGHGNSSEPNRFDHRISSYARFIIDFLKIYKQKNGKNITTIVGHSLGGATATI